MFLKKRKFSRENIKIIEEITSDKFLLNLSFFNSFRKNKIIKIRTITIPIFFIERIKPKEIPK